MQYEQQQDPKLSKFVIEYETLDEESSDAEEITGKESSSSTKGDDNSSIKEVVDSKGSNDEEVSGKEKSNTTEDVQPFTVVQNARNKKYQKYSKQCEQKFYCKMGLQCEYSHTPEEKEEFKQRRGRKIVRKTDLCWHFPTLSKT